MIRRATLAAVLVAAAGCSSGTPDIPVPSPDAATAALCKGLKLPEKLDGHERRDTGSPFTAAWGSPAIALRCGVPRPADPESGIIDRVVVINGLDWLPTPLDRPAYWTLVGRDAYVEVTIPPEYLPEGRPPGELLTELTDALGKLPKKPPNIY